VKRHYDSIRRLQNTAFVVSVIDFSMIQTLSDSTTWRFIPSVAQAAAEFSSAQQHCYSIRNPRNTGILGAHMRKRDRNRASVSVYPAVLDYVGHSNCPLGHHYQYAKCRS
jgi:hypothetical protein